MRTDDEIEGIASAAGAGSRLPGFYRLSIEERRRALAALVGLAEVDLQILESGGLSADAADRLVENAIGVYSLPLGLAANFRVNGRDTLVPMAVEEPSVIAAASNAARLVRAGGGFTADADDSDHDRADRGAERERQRARRRRAWKRPRASSWRKRRRRYPASSIAAAGRARWRCVRSRDA